MMLTDLRPFTVPWHQEVWHGLHQPQKELPSKLFYDERGSQLFDQITELREYYPTRTEWVIMEQFMPEIVEMIGPHSLLIEYGSGSSKKTRLLLRHLPQMAGYIPIDISEEHLRQSAEAIRVAYPRLDVLPVIADYEAEFGLPIPQKSVAQKVIYFPGSTIGNFHPAEAVQFMQQMRTVCGKDCALLIGVDLKKDNQLLHLAYNDCAGVTAAFNLNILHHLNRELGADFDVAQFEHCAFYNEVDGRIEMHLISTQKQTVHLFGEPIHFAAGECIWTESSYKYTVPEFAQLAEQAGFAIAKVWTDPHNLFSVQYCVPDGRSTAK